MAAETQQFVGTRDQVIRETLRKARNALANNAELWRIEASYYTDTPELRQNRLNRAGRLDSQVLEIDRLVRNLDRLTTLSPPQGDARGGE